MSIEPSLSTEPSYRPRNYAVEGRLRLRARQLVGESSARLRRRRPIRGRCGPGSSQSAAGYDRHGLSAARLACLHAN